MDPLAWEEIVKLSHGTEAVYTGFTPTSDPKAPTGPRKEVREKKPDNNKPRRDDKKPQQDKKKPANDKTTTDRVIETKHGLTIQRAKKTAKSIFDPVSPAPAGPANGKPTGFVLSPLNIVTK